MSKSEYKFLRRLLPNYYYHIKENRNTLITRIFGFHKIFYNRKGLKVEKYFIVLANAFSTDKEIHRRFDLKGSRYKRTTKPAANVTIARKDMDFINENRRIDIGPQKKATLVEILAKDAQFFAENRINDFSLLVGIHQIGS